MPDPVSGVIKKAALRVAMAGCLSLCGPFVSAQEGLSLTSYSDAIGIPTVCYGHTAGVELGQMKSRAECDQLLADDLMLSLAVVDRAVKVPMPDTRRAALASFEYNVGPRDFLRSSLLRKLNAGDTIAACNDLLKWVYAGGRRLPGLVKRRQAERALCLKGTQQEGI